MSSCSKSVNRKNKYKIDSWPIPQLDMHQPILSNRLKVAHIFLCSISSIRGNGTDSIKSLVITVLSGYDR